MRLTQVLKDFKKVGELTKKYSNLPDSYIKRSMEQIYYRTRRNPAYLPRTFGRKTIKFSHHRPWTLESKMLNPLLDKTPTIYLEPIKDWSIFKGDRVEILNGPDKGKQGIVQSVIQERNWVIVERLNMKIDVLRKEEKGRPAVIGQSEKPLRVTTDVALIDPSDMLPCEIQWRYTEKGEKVRVSVRSGRIVPVPIVARETYDFKTPTSYEEKGKDTRAAVVGKVTYEPSLSTFEMDIMKAMGIEEDRTAGPVYWY
ncbi:hypothetical protein V9T40_000670 [Parthenolecanium corni]|uniref:Large ribosomal subunit protein uL24m n=1 Tax=Parthenolecanium corni TaxID=536013 RepID=A0AAN9TBG2_9HEMI